MQSIIAALNYHINRADSTSAPKYKIDQNFVHLSLEIKDLVLRAYKLKTNQQKLYIKFKI